MNETDLLKEDLPLILSGDANTLIGYADEISDENNLDLYCRYRAILFLFTLFRMKAYNVFVDSGLCITASGPLHNTIRIIKHLQKETNAIDKYWIHDISYYDSPRYTILLSLKADEFLWTREKYKFIRDITQLMDIPTEFLYRYNLTTFTSSSHITFWNSWDFTPAPKPVDCDIRLSVIANRAINSVLDRINTEGTNSEFIGCVSTGVQELTRSEANDVADLIQNDLNGQCNCQIITSGVYVGKSIFNLFTLSLENPDYRTVVVWYKYKGSST